MPTSLEIFQRASYLLPGGVSSPVRRGNDVGMATPFVAARGEGPFLFSVEEEPYLDFCMGWGALLFGHAHPYIVQELQQQLLYGTVFGTLTPLEPLVADKIGWPHIEKIRFCSSGTESTMTAIKLARAIQKRQKIALFSHHYHGHSDAVFPKSPGAVGGENIVYLPFNRAEETISILRAHPDIAAILVEPIMGNCGVIPPVKGFFEKVEREVQRRGILWIFDEVITGFRVGRIGVLEQVEIVPDLICLGKIVGGGLPLAAVGGKREWMEYLSPEGSVFHAGTFAGNPLSLRASLSALTLMDDPDLYPSLEEKGALLERELGPLLREKGGTLSRVGSMFSLFFGVDSFLHPEKKGEIDTKAYAKLFFYLLERKIFIPPSPFEAWFLSTAHEEEHLDRLLREIGSFLHTL